MVWIFALGFVVLLGVASVTSYSIWALVLLLVAFALATLLVSLIQGRDEPLTAHDGPSDPGANREGGRTGRRG